MTQLTVSDLQDLNTRFENEYPQTILRWAVETFGETLTTVTSFQPTGVVTLHMLAEAGLKVDVMTLDTGLLFPETYQLIDLIEARFNLKVNRIRPALSVPQQAAQHGEKLWERDPDACCQIRKVIPLDSALEGYAAWFTGLRRDQGSSRKATSIISIDKKSGRVKIAPLATWTEDMIWTYIDAYDLPYNALHNMNYPSIGCWPCTQPVTADNQDPRAGRWEGNKKTECGIHLPH